jgi:hypothetical protein
MQNQAVTIKARKVSRAYCKWQRALLELETSRRRWWKRQKVYRPYPGREADENKTLLIQFLKDAGLFRSVSQTLRIRLDNRRYSETKQINN